MIRNIKLFTFLLYCYALQPVMGKNTASVPAALTDIRHYKINLRFNCEKKKASGQVTISVTFTEPAQHIQFAANDFLIHSVHTGEATMVKYTIDTVGHFVIISLPRQYIAGETEDITIVYETMHVNEPDPNAIGGSLGKGIRYFQPSRTNPVLKKQLWSQSELQNTSYWLPCNPNLSDISTTEFTGTVEKELTFITNGTLQEKKENPDGSVSFRYRTDIEYPIYLAAFAAGTYSNLVQHVNGVALHTFCYPDEMEAAKATTQMLPDMLLFLENKTGLPYPFKQYSQVMVQDYPFPSLTGQNGLSLISDNMIDDFGTHRDFLYLWDGVEFNALASQWFGNIIIPERVEDLWLAKSFAQFFEGLYVAEKNSMDEYLLWYHPWETANTMADWTSGNRHPIAPEKVMDEEVFAGDSYAKYKGALVLRMLQREMGDEMFLKAVKYFIKKNAFKPATTGDFQNAVAEISGKNMHWFFDQWIYKTGVPVFEVSSLYDTTNHLYHLTLKQIQATDTTSAYHQVKYFQGTMQVQIDQKTYALHILPQEENTFTSSQSAKPQMVIADVGRAWISEIIYKKTWQEWEYLLLHSTDMAARNTAMNELVKTATEKETPDTVLHSIINTFQRAIQSNDYWRFRFNVIGQLRTIQSLPYDKGTTELLISLIKKEKSWVKAAAITNLGLTKNPIYSDVYVACLKDSSDRVINAAAIALGRSKSPKTFGELVKLKNKPSWKSQSLMHCLAGLAQLGDERGAQIAYDALTDTLSPRWQLGNGWDFPFVATQTLATLGITEKAYQLLLYRFTTAMNENSMRDIFYQALLIVTLADPRGLEIIEPLKSKFQSDTNAMLAIKGFEEQLKAAAVKSR